MLSDESVLPIVRPLPDSFSIEEAFEKLCLRPHCLWLDSASRGPTDASAIGEIGRYSFLTADPVATLTASIDQVGSPWSELDRWCQELPMDCDPTLPPFQGGIAGLIGYEAASWLEPVGLARENDLPTPPMSLGLYDWTIATDHHLGRSWLISQGLGEKESSRRLAAAAERADEIESLILYPLPRHGGSYLRDRISRQRATPTGQVSRMQQTPLSHRNVTSNFTSEQFQAHIAEIVRGIHDGDSFQVNFSQRLLRKADLPAAKLYPRLRAANPAPFGAYYAGDDFAVLSSSPEGFLKVRQRKVETRPIKGTIPRTGDARRDERLAEQLSASEKDRAENIMIVDLMRNDFSRVCKDESVQVRQLCKVERYQYVQHLVSVVQGELREDQSIADLLQACFPGGSITGAPKIEAMQTIARLEKHHRGPYCGSLGYISCGGSADFNILIRTITAAHGYWQIPVGGGITARSQPAAEEAETWTKAEGMLRAMPS